MTVLISRHLFYGDGPFAVQLQGIRSEIENALATGKISESQYGIIDNKIGEHLRPNK